MSESVNLPALGESVTEGTVTRWLKNVGDSVEVDEPLLEVSTDKVDTEIPSPIAGVIEEILVAEDETVEVGTALVRIGDGSGGGDAPAADAPAAADSGSVQPADDSSAQQPDASAQQPAEEPTPAEPEQAVAPAPAAPAPAAAPAAPAPPAAAPAPVPAAAAPAAASAAPAPEQGRPEPERESSVPTADNEPAPIEEVPSNDAPAPGEGGTPAPAPAQAVDAPPAAAPAPDIAPLPSGPELVASSVPAPAVPSAQDVPEPQKSSTGQVDAGPATSEQSSSFTSNAGYVTPLVRKLAHEKGVDLASLSGTGVGGRIRKEDVLDAAAASAAPASEATPVAQAREPLATSPLRGTTVPMSRLRKVIAERAVHSMQSSAQLTSVVEVDVTKVAAFRSAVKDEFLQKAGVKLSFLPFFALAAAEALKAYPIINATIDTESNSIVYPGQENLSIAVDTERGLLTPVIRDASDLDLARFAQQIADLAERTRDNKLKPDELAGGTFTLTNTGSRGALFDTPVVFLPQSAILGTGIVTKKPVVISQDGTDAIAIRSTVYLALSYDHRIVDGADAARFLVAVKDRLEGGDFGGSLGI